MVSRRKVLIGSGIVAGLAGVGGYFALKPIISPDPAVIGFELRDGTLEKSIALLKKYPSVDVHSHPGRTFVRDASGLKWQLKVYSMLGSFEEKTIADMRAGHMGTVNFSGVADFPLLAPTKGGLAAVRDFEEGEAWDYYQAQMDNLHEVVKDADLRLVLQPADIAMAHEAGVPGAFLSMEGGDFLAQDLSRIGSAFERGVRMLTIVHYNNNAIGDIITDSRPNGGLSEFGRDVVRAMNRVGMMIDVAHASEPTAFKAMEVSTKPVCITHTHVRDAQNQHPRFISRELAKAVVEQGGFIGAWPAGIGLTDMNGFMERIDALVQTYGVEHIAIGSDMDGNYKPVYDNFRDMPLIVGWLLDHGYDDEDIAKIIGGNFIRVFEQNAAA